MRCKACDKKINVTMIRDEFGERMNDLCSYCTNAPVVTSSYLARYYTFNECEDEISQLIYENSKKVLDI